MVPQNDPKTTKDLKSGRCVAYTAKIDHCCGSSDAILQAFEKGIFHFTVD